MPIKPHPRCRVRPRAYQSAPRYLCELAAGVFLVCITIHTFFLAGWIVPITVSSGSMAETLLGPRRWGQCPRCEKNVFCGHERLPADGVGVCLNCGSRKVEFIPGRDFPGQRTLIDRASLAAVPPRRWEIMVFRCPDRPDEFCIKRVVGLPGEEIELREGDLYVNGEIARKTLRQCRAVAQPVHQKRSELKLGPYEEVAVELKLDWLGWYQQNEKSHWKTQFGDGFRFHFPSPVDKKQAIDWLEFHRPQDRPLMDDDDYNQTETRRLNRITDVMLHCNLFLHEPGDLFVRGQIANDLFELHFAFTSGQLVLKRAGKEVATADIPQGSRFRPLEVIRFDRRILVALDDEVVLSYPYEAREEFRSEEETSPPAWSIGARTGHLDIRNLQILRDIYYTVPHNSRYHGGAGQPVKLGPDGYFVLGDNSPISDDSRTWPRPEVSGQSLVGRLLGSW